jgi:hypothetical protein
VLEIDDYQRIRAAVVEGTAVSIATTPYASLAYNDRIRGRFNK